MRTKNKYRLQTTLVVPFVLQIVTAVGLVGYISFRSGQQTVNSLASQLRQEITARINAELKKYLDSPHHFNRLNGEALARGGFDMARASNAEQFLTQVEVSPFIFSSYCGDPQGQFLGAYRLHYQGSSKIVMSVSNPATKGIFHFYDMDKRGNQQGLVQKLRPYDPRQRPWWKSALEAKGPVWSKAYLSFSSGLLTITASLPIYNQEGKLLGICATDLILLEDLHKFLANLSIGKNGQSFVMDKSGALLSSSAEEQIAREKGDRMRLLQAQDSSVPLIRETTRYLQQEFRSLAKIETVQQLDYKLDNKRQLVQVLPLKDGKGIDWLIVVVVPESDFLEAIYQNTRDTILLCGAALAIAIGIGIVTARWITQPILRISEASNQLAEGNLNQQVASASILEIDILANSFNRMAEQLRESIVTLEERVEERTADLAQANEEISILNDRLKRENVRMGAELDVLKQMQQMILPKPEELQIPGLDIAGFMEPADEVGGDYYDVLQVDGIVTIGMGDVAGHGLESGLLMLMTQAALRTLKEVQEHDPIRFLEILNRTLYKNVQRMNSTKNLTLVVLNYTEGKVRISGQHEETIVVRKNRQIERIDTMDLGLPLGLDDDIADFISHKTVELAPGDGIVLYTDGITEAKDTDKKLYGIDQLCDIIAQNWHRSATEILDEIIADVRRHIGDQKVFDDITLLVMKQC